MVKYGCSQCGTTTTDLTKWKSEITNTYGGTATVFFCPDCVEKNKNAR